MKKDKPALTHLLADSAVWWTLSGKTVSHDSHTAGEPGFVVVQHLIWQTQSCCFLCHLSPPCALRPRSWFLISVFVLITGPFNVHANANVALQLLIADKSLITITRLWLGALEHLFNGCLSDEDALNRNKTLFFKNQTPSRVHSRCGDESRRWSRVSQGDKQTGENAFKTLNYTLRGFEDPLPLWRLDPCCRDNSVSTHFNLQGWKVKLNRL